MPPWRWRSQKQEDRTAGHVPAGPLADPSLEPLVAAGFGRRYRRTGPWAIRAATMSVPAGSITALVGPNGAGKSTLIRACLGFERPNEGQIKVFGLDPTRDPRGAISAIGYVPQASSLYAGLTIADHLLLAAAARSTFDRAHAAVQIDQAGLDEKRRVSELSGGERAKVALALALGTRAPLLLLDEPLASLDPLARREFLGLLLHDVRARRATAVLSSHIVSDVEQVCDRLVVLGGGRVVLDTSISSALERYRTEPSGEVDDEAAIGRFADSSGEIRALVAGTADGRPASVEEIVLGHLARARTPAAGAAT